MQCSCRAVKWNKWNEWYWWRDTDEEVGGCVGMVVCGTGESGETKGWGMR